MLYQHVVTLNEPLAHIIYLTLDRRDLNDLKRVRPNVDTHDLPTLEVSLHSFTVERIVAFSVGSVGGRLLDYFHNRRLQLNKAVTKQFAELLVAQKSSVPRVAALYPKLSFINRKLYIEPSTDIMADAVTFLQERGYVLENDGNDTLTFRLKGKGSRILKMCEDRITITRTSDGYFMEGHRKDVLRLASGLEYKFQNPQD